MEDAKIEKEIEEGSKKKSSKRNGKRP
jgi:hypothetical protein